MSLHKVKLQLNNISNINDKNTSPTKLLINHGKPNFTINRQNSNNKKYNIDTVDSSSPSPISLLRSTSSSAAAPAAATTTPTNEINKVVLKSVHLNNESFHKNNINSINSTNNQHEFMQKHKNISEKIIAREQATKIPSNYEIKSEFLEKHRKIVTDKSTICENIENSPEHFNNIIKLPATVPVTKSKIIINHNLPPGAVCGKPSIPVKPIGLVPITPPIILNGHNNKKITSGKPEFVNGTTIDAIATTETTTATTINNDTINFEQKPIVSFSKDLSTEPNRYPDTVKIIQNAPINDENIRIYDEILNEMSQLKFDIKTNNEDVIVTPVIR